MKRTRFASRRLAAIGMLALLPSAAPRLASAGEAADDQATADAAVEAFNVRMLEVGFVSEGPQEQGDTTDADEQQFLDSECMQEVGLTVPSAAHIPGETATAYADTFTYKAASTTSSTNVPTAEAADFMTAFIITVDNSHRDELDSYIDYISSEARLRCLREFFVAQSEFPEAAPADSPASAFPTPTYEFTVDTDLGIGDRSARVDVSMAVERFDKWFEVEMSLLLARSDRSLVFLAYGTGADGPLLDVDVDTELEALVDSL